MMEAIVLAGGLGTRLRSVVKDVPKPMADVNGRPFLAYLLDYLVSQGITHIVLAVGYKKESIIDCFGLTYKGCPIEYSIEDTPLGTGGAIKQALIKCKENNVFILNGDTFFDVNLKSMLHEHLLKKSTITIAVKDMKDFDRYGIVNVQDGVVLGFKEKTFCKSGLINGGVLCIKNEVLSEIADKSFSLEKDFLEKEAIKKYMVFAYKSKGFFIDIGIPEDYILCQKVMAN